MKEVLRHTWMITWRLWIVNFVLTVVFKVPFSTYQCALIGFVAAIVLAVLGIKILSKPVSRIRQGLPFFEWTRRDGRWAVPGSPARGVSKASQNGPATGFEPHLIKDTPVYSTRMHGTPGGGLLNSDFDENSITAGVTGEMNFARALAATDGSSIDYSGIGDSSILNRVESFWSCGIPDYNRADFIDPTTKGDIDCIILTGRNLYLIDLKFYRGGDITYSNDSQGNLVTTDNQTGRTVGKPYQMSGNMAMAYRRVKKHYSHLSVKPCVVLVPQENGQSSISPGTVWSGGIPVMNMTDIIQVLAHDAAKNHQVPQNYQDIRNLSAILKNR